MITDQVAPLTLTQILTGLNSLLIVLAGYLLREAWREMHRRVDDLERRGMDFREAMAGRMSAVETEVFGGVHARRKGDG